MLLLDTSLFIAAGSTVLLALADKALESHGYRFLSVAVKIAIPLLALITSVYFIEVNPLLRWL